MKQLQLSRPHALLLVGIPGSGKTFFGEQFAQTFSAPYISQSTLSQYADNNDVAGKNLSLLFLREVAKTKATFVYDGDLHTRASRLKVAELLKKLGYQPIVIWVQTDPASARQRVQKQLSNEDFERAVRTFQTPDVREKVIVMSGKHTFASQLKHTLAKLTANAPRGTIEPGKRPSHSIAIR